MVARFQTASGVKFSASGLPTIAQTDEELRIAALPGLIHYLEPGRFAGSPLKARDRASPGRLVTANGALTKLDSDTSYANLPTINFPDGFGGLRYEAGLVPQSFTAIVCAHLTAAQISAQTTSGLLAAYDGDTLRYSWRWQVISGAPRMTFSDNFAVSSGGNTLPNANLPAGDVPAVWVLSYDAETRVSRCGVNTAEVQASFTHTTTAPTFGALGAWQWGLRGGASWEGHIASAIVLDRAYHLDPYQPLLDREVVAMKSKFGIA